MATQTGKSKPAQSALNEIDVDGAGRCMDVAEPNAANWHVKSRIQRMKLQARVAATREPSIAWT
jgi:hypothetical protein